MILCQQEITLFLFLDLPIYHLFSKPSSGHFRPIVNKNEILNFQYKLVNIILNSLSSTLSSIYCNEIFLCCCFSWVFGDFLCKMYQFVHSLSYTASIFILVVICTERYFAIIHPITCKQILTSTRLRVRFFEEPR